MNSETAYSPDVSDWTEKFGRLSAERRRLVLDGAVRKIAHDQTNPNEKEMSVRQVQAALEIDPRLVFEVLAAVQGDGISAEEAQKLEQRAVSAESSFIGLVNATQTLRDSLVKMGAIKKDGRLPETIDQWNAVGANLVAQQTRQLEAQKDFLAQQKQELEKKRTETLAEFIEIVAVVKSLPRKGRHIKLALSKLDNLTEYIADNINSVSLNYDQIKAYEPGQLVQGKGIFTKLWTPTFADGTPVGIECEIWAAPQDLRHAPGVGGVLTYLNSVQAVGKLKNWHGHDGGNFANEDAIARFIDKARTDYLSRHPETDPAQWFSPTGIDKWFIPSGEILDGKVYDANNRRVKVSNENLYDLRNTGAFADSFTTQGGSDDAHWYWSSTENRGSRDYVWNVRFSGGDADWDPKDNGRLSCRLVRVGSIRHLAI